MENTVTVTSTTSLAKLAVLRDAETAQSYADQSKAENTIRAYESDWKDFTAYCQARSLSSLPADPETVSIYISHLAKERNMKPATIARRLASISTMHLMQKLDSPAALRHFCVKSTWDGIKRSKGTAQTRKDPTTINVLRALIAETPDTLTGIRDRALLLLGFAAAFRRSELVALRVEDLKYVSQGLEIVIRSSKTDQEGAGHTIGIWNGREAATCPVSALTGWLTASGITSGPIFRSMTRHQTVRKGTLSGQAVARLVKRYAKAARLTGDFSGHSLRAGCITAAALDGANERDIMRHSRQKNVTTVRKYIRDGERFHNNISGRIGL